MSVLMRATIAILLTLTSAFAAVAADKPYHRDDLADTAIRLEGEIKANAGTVGKPLAALRRDADAALARNDARAAVQVLGQIVTVAPGDSASWLRLARATLQLRSANPNERAALLDRAATAAYIAYQRSGEPRRRGRCAGRARTLLRGTRAVAPGARRLAAVARSARGGRRSRKL